MEGLTVLGIHSMTEVSGSWGLLGMILLLTGATFLISGICLDVKWQILLGSSIALIGIGAFLLGTHSVTLYEVMLEDEINFKAFLDRYEVIDCKGIFYTIRERIQ